MATKPKDEQAGKPDPETPASSPSAAQTSAQSEFQRYKERLDASRLTGGQMMMMVPVGLPRGMPGIPGIPAWALPPSVAAIPAPSGWPAAAQEASGAAQTLFGALGTTLKLGIDVVNAALFSGARALEGVSGMALGYRAAEYGGCGCCEQNCCEYDCCQDCGCAPCCCEPCCSSCQPGVGNCC
ncbi:hypothetical protein OKW43_008083 [Paraburkholderia sp. WC7.3g]|uniref:hypothetical protein n=1 Tax=Paraburkholderia sp. WC7.3g TaxID=2991070 RepID=UPI003D1C80EA